MSLWRIVPVTDVDDARWLDHRRWEEVIVRADTAGLALSLASRELAEDDGQVGNESVDLRSGIEDEKLYHAARIDPQDAGLDAAASDGPPAILRAVPAAG